MKVKILVDNRAQEGLQAEWGLSFAIEFGGLRLLLDSGASAAFSENAEKMGVSLADIDLAVLSHAHFDHADGFPAFFAKNDHAPLYLRASAGENCYSGTGEARHYIGIQPGLTEAYAARLRRMDGKNEIAPGVWLLPHTTPGLERCGKAADMTVEEAGCFRPDDFAHEQSLVLEDERGLVIFNSCCHGGADTIVHEVRREFPEKPIRAILGGFHLYETPADAVRRFAVSLRESGVQQVVTGHCTGDAACEILRETLGNALTVMASGMELVL